MQSKKKIIWCIIAGLTVIILATIPYTLGVVMEKKVSAALPSIQTTLAPFGVLTTTYQRGYLHSEVALEFTATGNPAPFKSVFNISHLEMSGELKVDKAEAQKSDFFKTFQKIPDLLLKIRALPFQGLAIDLSATPFSTTGVTASAPGATPEQYKIDSESIRLSALLDTDQSIRFFHADIPKCDMLKGDLEYHIVQLKGQWQVSGSRDLSNMELSLDAESLKAKEESYGPGKILLTLTHFDMEAFATIKSAAGGALMSSAQGGGDQSQLGLAGLGPMMQAVPKIIEKKPELEIKQCHLESNQGKVDCYGLVTVLNANETSLFSLLTNLKVVFDLKGPEPIFVGIVKRWLVMQEMKTLQAQLPGQAGQVQLPGQPMPAVDPAVAEDIMKKAQAEAEKKVGSSLKEFYDNKYLIKEGELTAVHFKLEQGSMSLNGTPFVPKF